MNEIIYCRFYTEVSSEEDAKKVADEIKAVTDKYCSLLDLTINRYWKIPEYFEIFMRLSASSNSSEAYKSIVSSLGEGWEEQQPLSESIWNYEDGNSLIIDSIRWAHLEIGS